MTVRVGINGFGRIGRQVLRAIGERNQGGLEVVAINDLASTQANAHLFKYDSTYGRYPGTVEVQDNSLIIDGRPIHAFGEKFPKAIPWGDLGVEIVVESTGFFTDAEQASTHLKDSVKKVIISAPSRGEDLTIVLGVNEHLYDPMLHHVISNASCTTNSLAPLVKVLHDHFTILHGLMTTVHAYTNDQRTLDQVHDDLRRSRAAAQNIIPTSTGAARAVGVVLPQLKGKLNGLALRVPVSTGSITDLTVQLDHPTTPDEVNDVFKHAAQTSLKGILEYTEDPIVSSDIRMNPHSCIFDALSTMVMEERQAKVLGWYDNEWGYACRTADLCALLAGKGL